MKLAIVSTISPFLAVLFAGHKVAGQKGTKRLSLRSSVRSGRHVPRKLLVGGLFDYSEELGIVPSTTVMPSAEYYVSTTTDPSTCVPKPASSGCNCGTSHAFVMSKTGAAHLECVQLWADTDMFSITATMVNNDTLTFDVRPSSTASNEIDSSNTSWIVLDTQVQDFSSNTDKATDKSIHLTITEKKNGATGNSEEAAATISQQKNPIPQMKVGKGAKKSGDDNLIICRGKRDSKDKKKGKDQRSSILLTEFVQTANQMSDFLNNQTFFDATMNATLTAKALTAAAPDIVKMLSDNGYIFSTASLLFSMDQSPDRLPEVLVQSFEKLNDSTHKIHQLVLDSTASVTKDLGDTFLDILMSNLQSIDFAYRQMIRAYNETDDVKTLYSEIYRDSCNVPHSRPEDIIRNLYGYACGNATSTGMGGMSIPIEQLNCSEILQPVSRGFCNFGERKRNQILEYSISDSKSFERFNAFTSWMHSSLLLAYFHFYACLPMEATACFEKKNDPVFNETSKELGLALNENFANIRQEEQCVEKKIADAANPNAASGEIIFLPICRGFQAPNGLNYAFSNADVNSYQDDKVIRSKLTAKEANDQMEKTKSEIENSQKIISSIKDNVQAITPSESLLTKFDSKNTQNLAKGLSGVATALSVVSGSLAIVSAALAIAIPPPDVAGQVISAMNAKFDEISAKLDDIAKMVLRAIIEVKKDISDSTLDLFMDDLVAIDSAYKEYKAAANSTNVPDSIKVYYADKYRSACNVPLRTPADIIRGLYGYFCGNNTTPFEDLENNTYNCNSGSGMPAGFCNIAPRKKLGLLDTYDQWAANDVSKFRTLSNWVLPALTLAQFHHVTCLSPIADSCSDKSVDPIFNETTNQLNAAITEVGLNLARLDYCLLSNTWKTITPDWIKANVHEDTKIKDQNDLLDNLRDQIQPILQNDREKCFGCPEFYWAVITFSKYYHPDEEIDLESNDNIYIPKVQKQNGGQFTVNVRFDSGNHRYFHFMYRRKSVTDILTGKEILDKNNFLNEVLKKDGDPNYNGNEHNEAAKGRINTKEHNYEQDLLDYGYGLVIIRPSTNVRQPIDHFTRTWDDDMNRDHIEASNFRSYKKDSTSGFSYSGCKDEGTGRTPETIGEWSSEPDQHGFIHYNDNDYVGKILRRGWNGCYKFWF